MLVLVFRLGVAGKAGGAATGSVQIKVDQVGYRPDGEKVAVTAARKRCRRRKITWMIRLRMRAMRLRSIGKRRWYFFWRARFLELHEASRSQAGAKRWRRTSSGSCSRRNQWKVLLKTNDGLTA
jgi:hypothetical protein